jgi:predicted ATP-dependent serine protease
VITPQVNLSPYTVHSSASPPMSAANNEAQSSSDLPVRQGALSAEEIRAGCPQFRILIIGKANAGKTTILRKVCNAKPDAKPIIYDANGKQVKVRLEKLSVLAKRQKTNQKPGIILIVKAVLAV